MAVTDLTHDDVVSGFYASPRIGTLTPRMLSSEYGEERPRSPTPLPSGLNLMETSQNETKADDDSKDQNHSQAASAAASSSTAAAAPSAGEESTNAARRTKRKSNTSTDGNPAPSKTNQQRLERAQSTGAPASTQSQAASAPAPTAPEAKAADGVTCGGERCTGCVHTHDFAPIPSLLTPDALICPDPAHDNHALCHRRDTIQNWHETPFNHYCLGMFTRTYRALDAQVAVPSRQIVEVWRARVNAVAMYISSAIKRHIYQHQQTSLLPHASGDDVRRRALLYICMLMNQDQFTDHFFTIALQAQAAADTYRNTQVAQQPHLAHQFPYSIPCSFRTLLRMYVTYVQQMWPTAARYSILPSLKPILAITIHEFSNLIVDTVSGAFSPVLYSVVMGPMVDPVPQAAAAAANGQAS